MNRIQSRLALATVALGVLVAAQAKASVTYTVNETITGPLNGVPGNPSQTDSVIGTITTDGTLGVLHAANVLSWDLDLVDVTTPAYSYDLTQANSSVTFDAGSVLNASATGLFFDFTSTGAFVFQANDPGAGSGQHYWCLSQSYYACADGNSIAPGNVFAGTPGNDFVIAATGTQGQIGNSPLDQSPPTTGGGAGGVPEPAAWALMLIGFGGLGAALRRRRTLLTA